MMPAPNTVHDAFISLSEGKYINIQHILRIFAEAVRQLQNKLDRRQLYSARKLLNSTHSVLLRQLLGLSIFRRYKIAELSVEFIVIGEESGSGPGASMRFRLAHGRMERKRIRQARVKVSGDDQKVAEFRVDGELIDSVVISNKDNMCSSLQEK